MNSDSETDKDEWCGGVGAENQARLSPSRWNNNNNNNNNMKGKGKGKAEAGGEDNNDVVSGEGSWWCCKLCGKELRSVKALGAHMRVHSNSKNKNKMKMKKENMQSLPAAFRGMVGSKRSYQLVDVLKDGKPTCSICSKSFVSVKSLFGHMRCHPERTWRGMHHPHGYDPPSHSHSTTYSSPTPPTLPHHRCHHHHHHHHMELPAWSAKDKRGRCKTLAKPSTATTTATTTATATSATSTHNNNDDDDEEMLYSAVDGLMMLQAGSNQHHFHHHHIYDCGCGCGCGEKIGNGSNISCHQLDEQDYMKMMMMTTKTPALQRRVSTTSDKAFPSTAHALAAAHQRSQYSHCQPTTTTTTTTMTADQAFDFDLNEFPPI